MVGENEDINIGVGWQGSGGGKRDKEKVAVVACGNILTTLKARFGWWGGEGCAADFKI